MWASRRNSRRWLLRALVVALALAPPAAESAAEAPAPDGLTVSSNQDVALCRPKGSCFIPEPDDPIFIGDVIETFAAGRFDFLLTDTARILLLNSGKIRIDRGSVQMVEIELIGGMAAVETFGNKPLDVTLGDLRCRVSAGPVAISYQMPEKPKGSYSVANAKGAVTCFAKEGGTYEIEHNKAIEFQDGRAPSRHSIPEGFWSILSPSR